MPVQNGETEWLQTTLYKLWNGRYIKGELSSIQYDIKADLSSTGAYSCRFQTGPFTCEDEFVDKETVLLYMQNKALFTQQEAQLHLVAQRTMDAGKVLAESSPNIGADASDDGTGRRVPDPQEMDPPDTSMPLLQSLLEVVAKDDISAAASLDPTSTLLSPARCLKETDPKETDPKETALKETDPKRRTPKIRTCQMPQ